MGNGIKKSPCLLFEQMVLVVQKNSWYFLRFWRGGKMSKKKGAKTAAAEKADKSDSKDY